MRYVRWSLAIGSALGLLVLAACHNNPPANKNHVRIINFAFEPESLSIVRGDTVVWTNNGSVQHTTTSGQNGIPDSLWDSGYLSPGDSFVHAFPDTGKFPYYCIPHWSMGMKARIFVRSAK